MIYPGEKLQFKMLNSSIPKSALVLGSAPDIFKLRNLDFKGVKIGVGDVPWRASEFGPFNFWVCANSVFPKPWILKDQYKLIQSQSHILMALFMLNEFPGSYLELLEFLKQLSSKLRFSLYDQRHFNGDCEPLKYCCRLIKDFPTLTKIQIEVSRMQLEEKPAYSEGGSVALHGLATAILLRLNPIYVAGIELPNSMRSYKSYRNYAMPFETFSRKCVRLVRELLPKHRERETDFGGENFPILLNDFQSLISSAARMGIEIIVVSDKGNLLNLEGVKKMSYREFVNLDFD